MCLCVQVPQRELHADWQSDDIVVFRLSGTEAVLSASANKPAPTTGSH